MCVYVCVCVSPTDTCGGIDPLEVHGHAVETVDDDDNDVDNDEVSTAVAATNDCPNDQQWPTTMPLASS